MKKLIIYFGILFFGSTTIATAQEYYYWVNGEKIPLELYPERQYLLIQGQNKSVIAKSIGVSEENLEKSTLSGTINTQRATKPLDNNFYWAFLYGPVDKVKIQSSDVVYAAPSFRVNGTLLGLSQYFYVKLKQEKDIEILESFASKNLVKIVGNDTFMPLWYILACDKNSKGNALEMANLFYESGYFASSQPDLMEDMNLNFSCANDALFGEQWHLNNTGQAGGTVGNDISACLAWSITTGCPNIVVAVLDEGLEFNHPDFNNISPVSFDTENGSSPSVLRGIHGVPVAGIIGATRNNTLGVAGVAPGVQLMSISNLLVATPLFYQKLASGINFAWQNGAAVINNSWGWSSSTTFQIIDDAIQSATTLGRNGLGTVVVFASGNSNVSVAYPANNSQTIAVGAINRTPSRVSTSNYGAGIDVVAPGVSISTTDRQGALGYNQTAGADGDYTSLNGTSFAAPQVAGIAALILSVNPGLTLQQVRDVIESSTDKVGNYSYTLGAGEQPALTWNNEMGYGRVNAFRALQTAFSIIGPVLICTNGTFNLQNLPASTVVTWSSSNPSGLAINPTTGFATRQNNFSGQVTITATFSGTCNNISFTKAVTVGTPQPAGIIGPNYNLCLQRGSSQETGTYFVNNPLPGVTYHWEFVRNTGTVLSLGTGTSVTINASAGFFLSSGVGTHTIRVRTSSCGLFTPWVSSSVIFQNCSAARFSIYPNPVSDELYISYESDSLEAESMLSEGFEVTLINSDQKKVYSISSTEKSVTIPVSKYPEGVYYVIIDSKEGTIKRRILIER